MKVTLSQCFLTELLISLTDITSLIFKTLLKGRQRETHSIDGETEARHRSGVGLQAWVPESSLCLCYSLAVWLCTTLPYFFRGEFGTDIPQRPQF